MNTETAEKTETAEAPVIVELPPCPQCSGTGCGECDDELWYAAEAAAEEWRRDRAFDFAQHRADR